MKAATTGKFAAAIALTAAACSTDGTPDTQLRLGASCDLVGSYDGSAKAVDVTSSGPCLEFVDRDLYTYDTTTQTGFSTRVGADGAINVSFSAALGDAVVVTVDDAASTSLCMSIADPIVPAACR